MQREKVSKFHEVEIFIFLNSSDCDSEISKEKVEKFDMSDLDKYMVPISLNKFRKCTF